MDCRLTFQKSFSRSLGLSVNRRVQLITLKEVVAMKNKTEIDERGRLVRRTVHGGTRTTADNHDSIKRT